MTDTTENPDDGARILPANPGHRDLRELARALLDRGEVTMPTLHSDDISRLAQELQVAYAELQVQFQQIQDTQRRLVSSESRYRTLFEDSPTGNLVVDIRGRVLRVNRTLCRWLGRRSIELIDHPFVAFLSGKSQSAFAAYVRDIADRGPESFEDEAFDEDLEPEEIEVECRPRAERAFPVALRGRAMPPEEEHESPRLLITLTDLRQRRQLEDRLAQAQKLEALGILAGGIAHDFNNTLQIIRGYSELMLGSDLDEASSREMVRAVLVATERARQITAQIQMFSRRRILRPEVVDLGDSIQETLQLLRPLLGDDVVTVYEGCADPLPVRVDAGQLGQVVMNLAANARDAMPDGGRIQIEAMPVDVDELRAVALPGVVPGSYAMLRFRDQGTGIDPADVSRIFDPFFTTKSDGRGSGLGLATVYGIVRRAGGAIEVDSEPGRGTEFRVLLPLTDEAPASALPDDKPRIDAADLPGRVLLVDDASGVREVAARMLRAAGIEVVEEGDPRQALDRARNGAIEFDLLVTDVVMPYMNGFELVDALRETRPDLRALFVSGYTQEEIDARGGSIDEEVIVPKPFSSGDLLAGVARVVRRARRTP